LDHKDEILSDYKIDDLSGDGGHIELWSPDDQTADLFKDFDMDIPLIDNLPGCDPLVDFGGLLDDIVNAESTTSAVPNYRQCISDHQYRFNALTLNMGVVSKGSHTLKITKKIGDDRNNIPTTP